MKFLAFQVAVWLAIALHGALAAAQTPLTLAEAQRLAVERSRQLAAQNAAVAATREMARAVGQLPDPVLRLGIDNLPVEGPDQFNLTRDFMTMTRVGVMQEFTRSEKRLLRVERFEREADKTLAEQVATVASIQRSTALAWLDAHYSEALTLVIAEQTAEIRREIVAVEAAYRAGRGSQADVFAAHGAQVRWELQASELERRIRAARINLARWIGERADAPLAGKPAIDVIGLDTGTLHTQIADHPEIAVLSRQEDIAATEARIALADKKTDWSVEVAYQKRGSAYADMISVGVSIPLQWDRKNRQDRELASKLATAEQASAERDEALRAHIGEVRAMLAEWENGLQRLARYERELIPLARERTQAALAAYQGGKANLTDLLLARRDAIEIRMQAVQLEADIARLWGQLNFLLPGGAGSKQASESAQSSAHRNKEAK